MGKRRLYLAALAAQGASTDVPPTWRERLAALRYVPPLLRLVFQTHRGYTVSILLLRVVRSFVPVAALWICQLLIDGVIAGAATIRSGGVPDWRHLATLVGIELAIAVVGEGLARLSSLVESLLGDLFANEQSVRLMRHAATLDLAQFENAEVYDHLERARRQTVGRIGLLTLLLGTAQDLITLISLASVLLLQLPWLLLLLAVAVLPAFLGEAHFASLGYSLLFKWTPERRLLDYLRYIGASAESAKEVKLFGLSDFLVGRYAALSDKFYEENKTLSIRRNVVSTLLVTLGTLGYYGAYAVIIYRTVLGAFTIGTLPFLAGQFRSSRSLIQRELLQPAPVPPSRRRPSRRARAARGAAWTRACCCGCRRSASRACISATCSRSSTCSRRSSRSPALGRCRVRSFPVFGSRTSGFAIPPRNGGPCGI